MNKQQPAVCVYQDVDPGADVLLFIDNSNIFQNAKKYSAQKKRFIKGTPDFLCRIDIGRLVAAAVGGRRVLVGKLYGSEPPALASVWNAIRKQKVVVETFHRSKFTGKEKEIDTSLVADAVASMIENWNRTGENRTLILFSGDRDISCVVSHALKYRYKVEIFAFKNSVNRHILQHANEEPDKIKVRFIDDIFDQISFSSIEWSKPFFPLDISMIATFNLPKDVDKAEFFREFVEKSWQIFRLPVMGKQINNGKHIVLIPAAPMKEPILNFHKYIQPFMSILCEHYDPLCKELLPLKEFRDRERLKCRLPLVTLENRFEGLQIETKKRNHHKDKDKNNDNVCQISELELIATLQTSVDDKEEDDGKKESSKDFMALYTTQDFIPVTRKGKAPKKYNLYSKQCAMNYWCVNGLKCDYKHTDKERQFFKTCPDVKSRKYYKLRPCNKRGGCEFKDRTYLCPYAHGVEEARCISCGNREMKHWMEQCPLAKNK